MRRDVRDRLPLRGIADEPVSSPLSGERDDAGSQAMPFLVGDDLGLAPFHDGDAGVRGAEGRCR